MAIRSAADRLRAGELAAKLRFPGKVRVINRLIGTSQDFRDMLEELAEVEFVLADMESAGSASGRERAFEWLQCLDRLIVEIEEMLQSADVIWIDIGRLFRRR
jgi:hypothetical protein